MYQIDTTIWNEIGETVPLRTTWAQQIFPLPEAQMMEALQGETEILEAKGADSIVAAAYLLVMPLLWENRAISLFKHQHPELLGALPEVIAVDEAVILASKEFALSVSQQKKLAKLLRVEPV